MKSCPVIDEAGGEDLDEAEGEDLDEPSSNLAAVVVGLVGLVAICAFGFCRWVSGLLSPRGGVSVSALA